MVWSIESNNNKIIIRIKLYVWEFLFILRKTQNSLRTVVPRYIFSGTSNACHVFRDLGIFVYKKDLLWILRETSSLRHHLKKHSIKFRLDNIRKKPLAISEWSMRQKRGLWSPCMNGMCACANVCVELMLVFRSEFNSIFRSNMRNTTIPSIFYRGI